MNPIIAIFISLVITVCISYVLFKVGVFGRLR